VGEKLDQVHALPTIASDAGITGKYWGGSIAARLAPGRVAPARMTSSADPKLAVTTSSYT